MATTDSFWAFAEVSKNCETESWAWYLKQRLKTCKTTAKNVEAPPSDAGFISESTSMPALTDLA